ncbi:MAG: AAA family ATPase [Bacteroidetes bacterium]|nr:AAA family ATPase [Bacteroidota bacterium]MCL2302941.1 AAA family ATPase [Lentimicrobiaceae bacterium]
MNLNKNLKEKIVAAMIERRRNFEGSDAKFATTLGISSSQYSRITNGELDRVISDPNWISIARKLDVTLNNLPEWKTARTPVYEFVTGQLAFCQENAASRMLCDVADIGKTYTAKCYVKANKNAVYIDCSQVKSKQKLIRNIAKEFGVGHTGTYADVYADLVFYLRSLPQPLVILDEAGDLDYAAFLELKALWNATERCCGWYMMGADGLREKIRRSIEFKKVGYAELFSRYGSRYQKASPDSERDMQDFKTVHAALIIKANVGNEVDIQSLIARSDFSLRRIYDEVNKISAKA